MYFKLDFKSLVRFITRNPLYKTQNSLRNSKLKQALRAAYLLSRIKAERLRLGKITFEVQEVYFANFLLTRSFRTKSLGLRHHDPVHLLGLTGGRESGTKNNLKPFFILILISTGLLYSFFVGESTLLTDLFSALTGSIESRTVDETLTN